MSHFGAGVWGRQRGLTLIELMIGLTILGILLAMAVPAYRDAALSSQERSMANMLVASTLLARSEAIKRNSPVTMCRSTNGTACAGGGDWADGWLVGCLSSDNTNCNGGAAMLVFKTESGFPSSMNITETGGGAQLVFQPLGVGSTPAAFVICRADPLGLQERVVTIDITGRASVRRTKDGVCP